MVIFDVLHQRLTIPPENSGSLHREQNNITSLHFWHHQTPMYLTASIASNDTIFSCRWHVSGTIKLLTFLVIGLWRVPRLFFVPLGWSPWKWTLIAVSLECSISLPSPPRASSLLSREHGVRILKQQQGRVQRAQAKGEENKNVSENVKTT